ncbi:MAG: F0F1 ATP synthase subunit A [Parcubacteria group bacterium]
MAEGPVISIQAEKLFSIGSFDVTNSILLAVITLVLFLIFALVYRGKFAMIPRGLQNIMEWFVDLLLGLMESVLGNRKTAEQYLPLIATIFLFVMISNWLGLFPGAGSIGLYQVHDGHEVLVPLFRAPAADLNFTIAIAIISVLAANFLGIFVIGFKKYFGKFFTFKKPFPIFTFVGILEFISEFVKIISFSFRLFGNIFAGEVLLLIVAFLVPYFVPLPFLFLEIFVGFIQAFIFAMLTLVFVSMATAEEH